MPDYTIEDAEDRLHEILDAARSGPVRILNDGHAIAVVLSPSDYARLEQAADAPPEPTPAVRALHVASVVRFARTYEALAK